jgi:hypothetical protein
MTPAAPTKPPAETPHSQPIRVALRLLCDAASTARRAHRGVWEFAVEISELHAAGLRNTDLRYLLCLRYAEHAAEQARCTANFRAFRRVTTLALPPNCCFVLTDAGARAAARLAPLVAGYDEIAAGCRIDMSPTQPLMPLWDVHLRQLRWCGKLVKQYRSPAPNQEAILTVLEEEGWPPCIDDPLPPLGDIDAKERLHDTIKNLNRKQLNRLLFFRGDGTGQRVIWAPIGRC